MLWCRHVAGCLILFLFFLDSFPNLSWHILMPGGQREREYLSNKNRPWPHILSYAGRACLKQISLMPPFLHLSLSHTFPLSEYFTTLFCQSSSIVHVFVFFSMLLRLFYFSVWHIKLNDLASHLDVSVFTTIGANLWHAVCFPAAVRGGCTDRGPPAAPPAIQWFIREAAA